jgi:hypothetical protein
MTESDQSIRDEINLRKMELQFKRSAKEDRDEMRSIEKETKQLNKEEQHPQRTRAKQRIAHGYSGVKREVKGAWREAKSAGKYAVEYRKKNPPQIHPRPAGVHMQGPPAPAKRIRDIQSKGDVVTQTMDRNFFSSGPSELLNPNSVSDPRNLENLTGRSNPGSVSNLSFENLIGSNSDKDKEKRRLI